MVIDADRVERVETLLIGPTTVVRRSTWRAERLIRAKVGASRSGNAGPSAANVVATTTRSGIDAHALPAVGVARLAGIAGNIGAFIRALAGIRVLRLSGRAFDRGADTLTGRRILCLSRVTLDRGTVAPAGIVVELTAIRAGRIDAVVLATDARRSTGRPVFQRIAKAALARLGIGLVVLALRITGMLAAEAVAVAGQRLAGSNLTLLTITAGIAA
jgi:hypothetical protein